MVQFTGCSPTYFSPIWKRQLGYEDDEFPNDLKVLDQHIHPDDLKSVQDELLRIIAHESSSWEQRFRMRHKNGNYRWIFCRARVVEYANGQAARLLGSHLDVTDRVEIQEALKEALESQQEAIEAGNVGLWRTDTKTREVFYSAQWKRQIGYADHEIPNDFTIWEQHVHPDDREQAKGKIFEAIAHKKTSFEATYRMRHKNGSYRWILTRGRITEVAKDGSLKLMGSNIDLTKQIESQAALEASERHLRLAQRMAGMGSWEWKPATNEVYWSQEVFHLWGYAPGEVELNLEAISAHIHPDDLAAWRENRRACLEDGKEHDIEIRIVLPNGKTRWVAIYGNAIRDENGEVTLMAGVSMDISEHKQMKEDLRQREQQLSTLMNNLPGMAYRCENSMNWTPQFISSGAKALTGYASEKFIGDQAISYSDLIVPEDRERVRISAEQSLAKKGRAELEYRIRTASGEIRHVWEQGISVTDQNGKYTTREGIIMDVTEQVHNKQHLQRLTEILRSLRAVNQLITHTTAPLTLIHKATETLVRDRGFQHAWCILIDDKEQVIDHAEAVVDDSVLGISQHLAVGKIPACYEETLRTSKILTFIPNSEPCNGCSFHDETNDQIRLCGRLNYEGKTYGMLSVAVEPNATRIQEEESLFKEVCNDLAFARHNIERESEKQQIYDDMAIAKNQAETANRAKNDFLAIMSHEMRTPLNPIMGYASLMLENASEEDTELLQCILDSSKRMLRLVDRILEYSELERSSVSSVIKKFKLVDACQTAFEGLRCETDKFEYHFKNGGLGLIAIDDTVEVSSDSKMLIRILGNLLQNACKYTLSGSVTLTIGQKAGEIDPAVFQFVITDTGIGMEEATWSKYFEAFTQADTSYSRPYEGIGLGLAICNKLIAVLKGTIEVSSKLGEGSQFTVSLPMQIQASKPSGALLPDDSSKSELKLSEPLNILIVEDDVYNSSLAKAFISKLGGVAAVAPNGSVAVELCKRQTFDSILMDIRMPVMDGFEATALIQKKDQLNTRTPIIALTANGADSVEHKCQKLGMYALIKKPVQIRELHTVLQRIKTKEP
ncbi:PAS domain-containing hybrid sensor histidine kinase/response regulator [Coraliomargarita sp. W4R53]